MDVTFGFDPGGAGEFGWAVLDLAKGCLPCVRATGTAKDAEDAVTLATGATRPDDSVLAAGIDSPMYWTATGARRAEARVREAITACGAPNAGGTVQYPNSLRGACVVQGPITAILLRKAFPSIRITEAHPKALLWLLRVAHSRRPARDVSACDLAHLLRCEFSCEHERDAGLAAWSARAMLISQQGWQDLAAAEGAPLFVAGTVEYWLPLAAS